MTDGGSRPRGSLQLPSVDVALSWTDKENLGVLQNEHFTLSNVPLDQFNMETNNRNWAVLKWGQWSPPKSVSLVANDSISHKSSLECGINFSFQLINFVMRPCEVEFFHWTQGIGFTPLSSSEANICCRQRGDMLKPSKALDWWLGWLFPIISFSVFPH